MESEPTVLLLGASVRSAAFSARRAGLRPWALDLFADRDLAAVCPARAVPPGRYPAGLPALARAAPPGPWLYTGGLENRPHLVARIARERPLWGNGPAALAAVRDPFALTHALRAADLPCPAVRSADQPRPPGRWLVKPIRGAGGAGIRWADRARRARRAVYGQEFIEGEARSAVFVADADGCRLLGVTRQLVGEDRLHASPFRYCGSIGPLALAAAERAAWRRLGTAVAAFAGLRGLFGVDAILRDGVPWPVEVNPRYTASVEVLEYATGLRALALHRRAFELDTPSAAEPTREGFLGKAVYYAPRALTVPADGPWEDVLRSPPALDGPPAFADIPAAGQRIAAGRPVLTLFASGATPDECLTGLRAAAQGMDRCFSK
jgi:predicted ATP-grasp superfamily ATP-dependent carboligase